MKRDQQLQRKMNAQLMEEARRREGELTTDTQSLQVLYLSDLSAVDPRRMHCGLGAFALQRKEIISKRKEN